MAARVRDRKRRPSDSAQDAGAPPRGGREGARHGERDAPAVDGGGISAFLYDADGDDREVAPDKTLVDGLAGDDVLWVHVDSSQEGAVGRVTDLIPVEIESVSEAAENKPFIHDYGESFVLGVLPLPASKARPESETLICAVGDNLPGSRIRGPTQPPWDDSVCPALVPDCLAASSSGEEDHCRRATPPAR